MSKSWVEISLASIRSNVAAIRRRISRKRDIIAVVKANAYGHGARRITAFLRSCGVKSFATATLEEALELREIARDARILVLMGCDAGQERAFRDNELTASVFGPGPLPKGVSVELKIDTGMGRVGIPLSQARASLKQAKGQLVGVFSHFAAAETDEEFSKQQLDLFLKHTDGVTCRRHIANSAGLRFPEAFLDAVRPGLALYGVAPCPGMSDLRPALCWKTRVLVIRDLATGHSVGYGRTFIASRPTRIAVLPVGYADGYSRRLSNASQVRIRGRLAPVVGLVSMDFTTVDVTDLPDVVAGDEATLLEADAESPISAASLARVLRTIPYEVLTSIGARVDRVYVKN
jgi:alanine racemase